MRQLAIFTTLTVLLAISWPVEAQQGELGFEGRKERPSQRQFGDQARGPQRDPDAMAQRRLENVAEYLELSDEQSLQWQTTIDEHRLARQASRDRVKNWRDEFRQLAKVENPDLMQLGEIALAIHREVEVQGSSRDQLKAELTKILTPEQAEKFASFTAGRQFEQQGNRGRQRRNPGRAPGDG